MFKIGEFSKLTQVSIRMLRYRTGVAIGREVLKNRKDLTGVVNLTFRDKF